MKKNLGQQLLQDEIYSEFQLFGLNFAIEYAYMHYQCSTRLRPSYIFESYNAVC